MWKPPLRGELLLVLVSLFLMTACAGVQTPTAAPTIRPMTETPVGQSSLTSMTTLQPTPAPGPISVVTPTASPIPAPIPTVVACNPPRDDGLLLDLSVLRWETLALDGYHVRQLAGLDYPIIPLDLSPDGHWLAVAFQTGNPEGDLQITSWQQAQAAIAIIDMRGETHWWINTHSFVFPDFPYHMNWLPDGRVLWVDEAHQVFVGDGQNRRKLDAPVQMDYTVYASNGIAFAQAADGELWRVDLSSGKWEKVTTPRPPEPGGRLGYDFVVAQDGSYALVKGGDGMTAILLWRVPAKRGVMAEPLPDIKVQIMGHGGPSYPLDTQLANTAYWLLGTTIVLENDIWSNGFVIDTRTGRIITAEDLGLPKEYYLHDFRASLDGKWLAVSLLKRNDKAWQDAGLYVTAADHLTTGHVVTEVSVASWHMTSPAVILHNKETDTFSVAQLPFANATAGASLNDAMPPFIALPNRLFAIDANSSAHLLQFDLDGRLLNTLDLSGDYDLLSYGTGATDRVYFGAKGHQAQGDSICRYALVEWTVGP